MFDAIRRAGPRRLFLIADGPREERPGDAKACGAARAVVRRVDWECEVLEDFAPRNMGCGRRVSTGISWVFAHVERAIILEDDCLPHLSFFRYCEEVLDRYEDDERVMLVSGNNFIADRQETPYSYIFNRNMGLWGWASWRRAWRQFDMALPGWPELRQTGWLEDILGSATQADYWRKIFDRMYFRRGQVDIWDYHWTFAVWSQSGLAAMPAVNLVSNIGFGPEATHTRAKGARLADLPVRAMKFPLRHPPHVVADRIADDLVFRHAYRAVSRPPRRRLRQRLARLAPSAVRRILRYLRSRRTGWFSTKA